jgi:hypothetical protein
MVACRTLTRVTRRSRSCRSTGTCACCAGSGGALVDSLRDVALVDWPVHVIFGTRTLEVAQLRWETVSSTWAQSVDMHHHLPTDAALHRSVLLRVKYACTLNTALSTCGFGGRMIDVKLSSAPTTATAAAACLPAGEQLSL